MPAEAASGIRCPEVRDSCEWPCGCWELELPTSSGRTAEAQPSLSDLALSGSTSLAGHSPRDPPVCRDYRLCTVVLSSSMGSRGLNVGPYVCVASTIPPEPSLAPHSLKC